MEKYKVKSKLVPMVKGTGIRHLTAEDEEISGEMQSVYRSCVGYFLYITKHSRPDLCNSVRELSKVNKRHVMNILLYY